MPAGHGGRREERREETGHHRVPDQAVGQRMAERRRRLSEPAQVAAGLPQPEEVEVVDGEGHGYDQNPSRREHRPQHEPCGSSVHPPHDRRDRPPLPEHQCQHCCGGGDEGRPRASAVDRPGHPRAGDETDTSSRTVIGRDPARPWPAERGQLTSGGVIGPRQPGSCPCRTRSLAPRRARRTCWHHDLRACPPQPGRAADPRAPRGRRHPGRQPGPHGRGAARRSAAPARQGAQVHRAGPPPACTATTGSRCATVREMEGMAAAGLGDDLLLANEVLDARRLGAAGGAGARVTVAVDSAATIARGRARAGVREVLIDVNVGLPRCGCAPGRRRRAWPTWPAAHGPRGARRHGLRGPRRRPRRPRRARTPGREQHGAAAARPTATVGGDVVSAGGTGTYDINTWATEIQAGSYALMDTAYAKLGLPFGQALCVLATVISVNPRGYAVADCGLKALGMDHGNPTHRRRGRSGSAPTSTSRSPPERARCPASATASACCRPTSTRPSPTTSACTWSTATRSSRHGRSTCGAGDRARPGSAEPGRPDHPANTPGGPEARSEQILDLGGVLENGGDLRVPGRAPGSAPHTKPE